MNYYGLVVKDELYPLGKKYQGGFMAAVGNIHGTGGEIVLSAVFNKKPQIFIYDAATEKIKKTINPGGIKSVSIAAGDVNGDKKDEIITGQNMGRVNTIQTLDAEGNKLSGFQTAAGFAGASINVAAADANFDGTDEIIVMNLQ
jgi:hypothetical protein